MAYVIQAQPHQVFVNDSAGVQWEIHELASVAFAGGERTVTETSVLNRSGTIKSLSSASGKTLTIEFGANPNSNGQTILRNGWRNGDTVTITVKGTAKDRIVNTGSGTIAVATTGIATGSGTKFEDDPNFEVGIGLRVGASGSEVNYIVEGIASNTTMRLIKADGTAITAATGTPTWRLVEYAAQWQGLADMVNMDELSMRPGEVVNYTATISYRDIVVPTAVFA